MNTTCSHGNRGGRCSRRSSSDADLETWHCAEGRERAARQPVLPSRVRARGPRVGDRGRRRRRARRGRCSRPAGGAPRPIGLPSRRLAGSRLPGADRTRRRDRRSPRAATRHRPTRLRVRPPARGAGLRALDRVPSRVAVRRGRRRNGRLPRPRLAERQGQPGSGPAEGAEGRGGARADHVRRPRARTPARSTP